MKAWVAATFVLAVACAVLVTVLVTRDGDGPGITVRTTLWGCGATETPEQCAETLRHQLDRIDEHCESPDVAAVEVDLRARDGSSWGVRTVLCEDRPAE